MSNHARVLFRVSGVAIMPWIMTIFYAPQTPILPKSQEAAKPARPPSPWPPATLPVLVHAGTCFVDGRRAQLHGQPPCLCWTRHAHNPDIEGVFTKATSVPACKDPGMRISDIEGVCSCKTSRRPTRGRSGSFRISCEPVLSSRCRTLLGSHRSELLGLILATCFQMADLTGMMMRFGVSCGSDH